MTEEEAKTKWCPFARTIIRGIKEDGDIIAISGNRVGPEIENSISDSPSENPISMRCIGSTCMAWRGIPAQGNVNYFSDRDQGFCGLAGKP